MRIFSRDLSRETLELLASSGRVAWDIETNGLDPTNSQIGTCQIYAPAVGACVVTEAYHGTPSLLAQLLADEAVVKVFHHAPFDLAFMSQKWGVQPRNVACTKIAAKLLNPEKPADHFSLKYLMQKHFGLHLDKKIRFTDWMSKKLSAAQLEYAVGDIVKLLDLYDLLAESIEDRGLTDVYERCCTFLPTHVQLRLLGCPDPFKY